MGAALDLADISMETGYTVVLDATFIDQVQRQKLKAIARQAGVHFKGFWLEANAAALRERLLRRVNDPSDATISVLKDQLEKDVGEISWQRIDATQSCKSIRAAIRRAVNAGAIPPRPHGRR